MGRKKIRQTRNSKTMNKCQYSGKVVGSYNILDKRNAIAYLQSEGYLIFDFNLCRVLGGKKNE